MQVRRFLVNYTKENISPKFAGAAQGPTTQTDTAEAPAIQYPPDINPDDIPF
jgi:hypothetical protein